MTGRKSLLGIAVLCALVFSAISATTAFAGGRAFTCAPVAGEFSDAHCVTKVAGNFKHIEITNGTLTKITATNEKTASATTAAEVSKLKGKIAGVVTEVQCTAISSSEGHLTNSATFVSGSGILIYSGCTVTLPAGRECKVGNKGVITTKELAAHTNGLGANELEFEPVTPTEFAGVTIEGCKNNVPPANTYPVNGKLIAATSGATTTTTHANITAQGTLTFGGNPAGLEGALTISMEGGNPIVLT